MGLVFLIELVHADAYIVGQDKIQECLLLATAAYADDDFGASRAFFARERRRGSGRARRWPRQRPVPEFVGRGVNAGLCGRERKFG
jgi:hypothetical protein